MARMDALVTARRKTAEDTQTLAMEISQLRATPTTPPEDLKTIYTHSRAFVERLTRAVGDETTVFLMLTIALLGLQPIDEPPSEAAMPCCAVCGERLELCHGHPSAQ